MLRLLHLSDLHFGAHSRLAGQDHAKAGKSFHRALVDAEPSIKTEHRVDVVVVTGDLAEVGNPDEFKLAHEFLRALAGELGLEHRRFVFCPGNHDISRPLSQMEESVLSRGRRGEGHFDRRLPGSARSFWRGAGVGTDAPTTHDDVVDQSFEAFAGQTT